MLAAVRFDDLPGWREDDLSGALTSFARCHAAFVRKPYPTGDLGVDAAELGVLFGRAAASAIAGSAGARSFFERHFTPFSVRPPAGAGGLVTGFYEPVVRASRRRVKGFDVPLLRPPDNLVKLHDGNRPPDFDPSLAWGLERHGSVVECPDRAAIETGALDQDRLALAWLESAVDAFFIHVQGAARLELTDGTAMRVTFAAKSGHPFTAIGRLLVERGEIAPDRVSMQAIRAWLAAHPARAAELMRENRSYIFFREADAGGDGPVAAAKVPLTAGRSIAVDKQLHTFGTPVFVATNRDLDRTGAPFRRLMIAQDTGSAIVGAARGDLFMGTGDDAGELAGGIRAEAEFFILVPNAVAPAMAGRP